MRSSFFIGVLGLLSLLPSCALSRGVVTTTDGGGGGMDSSIEDAEVDASCPAPVAETCNEADDDCDGRVDEDFDLTTDLANCGGCGDVCAVSGHATAACSASVCRAVCDAAFLDCNGTASDGCEASSSAAATCGTCANDCTATATPLCMDDGGGGFACVASCTPPTELCGASCVDTDTSVAHCGGCDMPCASVAGSTVTCVGGSCEYACADGFGDCTADPGCETSTRTSTDCGTCGTACAIPNAMGSCATGTCEFVSCSTGFVDCIAGSGCETRTDTVENCGGCGTVCARDHASTTCPGGTCTLGACTSGFGDCDGMAATGCETDLTTMTNCGTCGLACTGTDRCVAGTCRNPRVVSEVGAGTSFACARIADGRVFCWGDNVSGQLGIGSVVDSQIPVAVPGISDAMDLAVGDAHVCVVHRGGAVSCWGENGQRQTGDTSGGTDRQSPFLVPGISDALQITAGGEHTCAVRMTGAVACWGRNDESQLGTGGGDRGTPMDVGGLTGARQVDAGRHFNCAIRTGGLLVCWGDASSRQLGDDMTTERVTPISVGTFTDAISVSCGLDFACVVHATGVVDCWGANGSGQLGDGAPVAIRGTIAPVMGLPAAGAAEVTCGAQHACVRTSGGALYCWGAGGAGQIGDGMFVDRDTAVSVTGAIFTSVSAGDQHTCAASATAVYCWGADVEGALGNGAGSASNVPVTVTGLPPP